METIYLPCDNWKDTDEQKTLSNETAHPQKQDITDKNYIENILDRISTDEKQTSLIEPEKKIKEPEFLKKTYSQKWPAYDLAKTNEYGIIKSLAYELIGAYCNSPISHKDFKVREELLCMILHTYFCGSLRKTISFLQSIKKEGLISKVPCYKTLSNYFSEGSLTNVLENLITISSIPLASFEKTLAIDSSGFSKGMYSQWSEYKWGKPTGKEREWLKLHACIGTKTNVFFKAEVTSKNVADCPEFPGLLTEAVKYVDAEEVVADLAYSSRKNMDTAIALGLVPFIPFKVNARGLAKGSAIWRTMFNEFQRNRETYMEKYHARSNVETNFHMLKTKFGNKLRTKSFETEKNELLTKVLVHNLCVLIQESFEMGIKLDFDACVKKMDSV